MGSRQISTLATPTLSRAQPVTAISPAMPVVLLIGVSKLPYGPEEFEYIELKNIGPVTLDLTGVHFTNGVDFSFSGSAG